MQDEYVLPEDLDLNEIFIGRERQLNDFRVYLEKWKNSVGTVSHPLLAPLPLPPSPNNKIQGFFVLLYGRGGFGKSTLLSHYHEIALEYRHELLVSEVVDWEVAVQDRRALFNITDRETIDAYQYFNILYKRLASALGKQRKEFSTYRAVEQATDKARKQAYDVLDQLQHNENFSWLRGMGVARDTLLGLISGLAPGAIGAVLSNELVLEKSKDFFDTGAKVGIEHLQHLHHYLQEKLGKDLSDYLDAPFQLGLALGKDLARFAERHPLLIFFDTYEEIDEGDKLLQICMGAAGEGVGWVISGRDNLWAGVPQRRRSLEAEHGYKDLVYPNRSLVVDFSADGVGNFSSVDINEYFGLLCQKTSILWSDAEAQKNAERIFDVTNGVPLAVRIAASLYLEHSNLAFITEGIDRREIVEQMVERYLIHTRSNPADRMRLYGLALLRRVEDPSVLAVALNILPDQSLEAELRRLHRRYGFIFTKTDQPSMHSEVRHFLRLWLLQNRIGPEVMDVIKRLRAILNERFLAREQQHHYAHLRERLEDKEWIQLYLDITELEFWFDPIKGVDFLLPLMCGASIYQREANHEARDLGHFFQEIIPEPFCTYWQWANLCLVFPNNHKPLREEFICLQDLVRLANKKEIVFAPPLPDCREELEAALWWRLAEAYSTSDIRNADNAIHWYQKARQRLPREEELHKAYEDAVHGRATLPMAPRTVNDFLQLGRESVLNNEPLLAIEHFNDALKIDKSCVQAYIERGTAYVSLNVPRQAIIDFDHALSLDPGNVVTLRKRGETFEVLKDLPRAIDDFTQASDLDPDNTMSKVKLHDLRTKLAEREKKQHLPMLHRPLPAVRQHRKHRLTWLLVAGIVPVIFASLAVFAVFVYLPSLSQPKPPACVSQLRDALSTLQPQSSSLKQLRVSQQGNQGVAWSPDGNFIASSDELHVYILNASNAHTLYACPGSDNSSIWRVAWSPDSKYVASGGDDGTMRIWNAADGTGLFTETQAQNVRGITWRSDGRFIASADGEGVIKIWNVTDLHHVFQSSQINSDKKEAQAYGLGWSHTGKYLAIPYGAGVIDIWDVAAHKRVATYRKHNYTAYFVSWSPDDKSIASVSTDEKLQVWSVATGKNISPFNAGENLHTSVFSVAWSPDGKYIAVTTKNGFVYVYSAQNGQQIASGSGPNYMYGVSWAPDSKHLATTNLAHKVQIWQMP